MSKKSDQYYDSLPRSEWFNEGYREIQQQGYLSPEYARWLQDQAAAGDPNAQGVLDGLTRVQMSGTVGPNIASQQPGSVSGGPSYGTPSGSGRGAGTPFDTGGWSSRIAAMRNAPDYRAAADSGIDFLGHPTNAQGNPVKTMSAPSQDSGYTGHIGTFTPKTGPVNQAVADYQNQGWAGGNLSGVEDFAGRPAGQGFDPTAGSQAQSSIADYLLGQPDSWAGKVGLTPTNVGANETFDPLKNPDQLAALYYGDNAPAWKAQQDAPFLQSQYNLLPFMDAGGPAPDNLQLANMTPDIIKALNTPGQDFNAPGVYDQIVGGNWDQSLGPYMDPSTQQATMLNGLQALAPYYSSDTLQNTYNMAKQVSDEWVRKSQTDPSFAAQYPSLTDYLRAQGADNWM